jgi:periplasmic copper chaperone A
MKSFSTLLTFLIILLSLAGCGSQGSLSVQDAWARPAAFGSNSAVYFLINNPANQEDVLLNASSTVSEHTEIHQTMMGADETMSMHPQHSVPVPARERVTFEPGGLHVMLVNLQRDLVEGEQIEVILTFQRAGEIILQVPVEQR